MVTRSLFDDGLSRDLVAFIRTQGTEAVGAIPAFEGYYPLLNGMAAISLFASRPRVLSFEPDKMRVWQRYSRNVVGKELANVSRSALVLTRGKVKYNNLCTADLDLWVHRDWVDSLSAWLEAA